MSNQPKIGIVDVGGGFRGIYGSGVLDACLDLDVRFDYCVGVSAGSANLITYLARQRGRTYRFYAEYGFRKEYAGMGNFLRKRSYIDLDYVYGTLSNSDGEDPVDYDAFAANPAEFYAVACNAETGEAAYLGRDLISRDHFDALKASCALPVACRPREVGGVLYFDGGMADPVPIEKAFADGCDKVVLILTKTRDTLRTEKDDARFAAILSRRYPRAGAQLASRYQRYNDAVARAKEYEKQGKLLIVAPDELCGLTTLKRTRESLDAFYQKGLEDARAIPGFLEK